MPYEPPLPEYEGSSTDSAIQMGLPLALLGGGLAVGATRSLLGAGKKLITPAAKKAVNVIRGIPTAAAGMKEDAKFLAGSYAKSEAGMAQANKEFAKNRARELMGKQEQQVSHAKNKIRGLSNMVRKGNPDATGMHLGIPEAMGRGKLNPPPRIAPSAQPRSAASNAHHTPDIPVNTSPPNPGERSSYPINAARPPVVKNNKSVQPGVGSTQTGVPSIVKNNKGVQPGVVNTQVNTPPASPNAQSSSLQRTQTDPNANKNMTGQNTGSNSGPMGASGGSFNKISAYVAREIIKKAMGIPKMPTASSVGTPSVSMPKMPKLPNTGTSALGNIPNPMGQSITPKPPAPTPMPMPKIDAVPPADQTAALTTNTEAPKTAAYYGGGFGAINPTDTTVYSEPIPADKQMDREPNPLSASPDSKYYDKSSKSISPTQGTGLLMDTVAIPDALPHVNANLHDLFLAEAPTDPKAVEGSNVIQDLGDLDQASPTTQDQLEPSADDGYVEDKLASLPHGVEVGLELGGLGMLAAPSAYHLTHTNKPSDKDSAFHRVMQNPTTTHAAEVAGLGTLAVPYLWDIGKNAVNKLKGLR